MENKLKNKILLISKDIQCMCVGQKRHLSYIMRRNKIISIGFNNEKQQHPLSIKYDFGVKGIHSELNSIVNYRGNLCDLEKCYMINIRINRFNEIRCARPCDICAAMLKRVGIKTVIYSDQYGDFLEMDI